MWSTTLIGLPHFALLESPLPTCDALRLLVFPYPNEPDLLCVYALYFLVSILLPVVVLARLSSDPILSYVLYSQGSWPIPLNNQSSLDCSRLYHACCLHRRP